MKPRFAASCLLGLWVLSLSGCVLVPALEPDKAQVAAYSEQPTLPNAIKVAESLRNNYSTEVKDQIITERVTALALIAAATVAADMSIRQVSKNDVLGLTLGSGAVYTATNFMVNKPQQYIYAAGANAVQCALDVVHPLRVANEKRGRLETLIKEIDAGMRDVSSSLDKFKNGEGKDPNEAEVARGRAAAEEARNLIPVATEALTVLDNSGGDLYSAVGRIQGEVEHAISENTPNLQSLMQQLGSALPALGSQITGVALPASSQKGDNTKSAADEDALKAALVLIKDLEAKLAETRLIIALVEAKPSTEKLKTCSLDLQQAGLTMKVTPSGALTVTAGQVATVSIKSGVLPYRRATWVGNGPAADKVELTTETGAGVVEIKTKADTPADTYVMLLQDSAQGHETVNVTIRESTVTEKNPPKEEEKKCTEDANLKKIQDVLVNKKGIKTVTVDGKDQEVLVDGCSGPRTDAAMRKYYKSQVQGPVGTDGKPKELADDAVPKSGKALIDAVSGLLKDEGLL